MKLEVTTKHELVFTVEYFEATDGGMDSDSYGDPVGSIEEAVHLLTLAKVGNKTDWIIVCRVKTIISKAN